jgi:ferredoxin-thioredoxin reductase catalytic chain
MSEIIVNDEDITRRYNMLLREASEGGYFLNPDTGFAMSLVRGLLVNESRYGYPACPCRLATGKKEQDLDIICPCDYRDPDLDASGACYCALYVSEEIRKGVRKPAPVPERRPPRNMRNRERTNPGEGITAPVLPFPVWRCRVCGYLCARTEPPLVCPVCKAKKDRFERFM